MKEKPVLSIVIPCYNEEEIIKTTIEQLLLKLQSLIDKNKISEKSFLVFVDDGSTDNTWQYIKEDSKYNIKGIKLSRNRGHQYALLAGIKFVENRCDCTISLDADLQDDIDVIDKMIEKYSMGFEIVYGIRKDRPNDTFFKRFTAENFYKLMKLIGVKIVFNHADYRLMSNKAISFFNEFDEVNLFIRGIIPLIGLNSTKVYYSRKIRVAGTTKYPLRKMISFALNGITSFSIAPLRVITYVGFIVFLFTIIMTFYTLYISLFTNQAVPGWASTVLPIYFIGGIQILSIGIVGEYIGRIYKETKKRPKYFIEEIIDD